MFKELNKNKTTDVEKEFISFWKKNKTLEKSIEKGKDYFVFYDGPIYANAKPGIHHVFAKTIKDSFCKYKTMQGYKVLRKIGLDTHGLPIEVNVEKKLGFKSKADIEAFGIENFCHECNKETDSNIDEVRKVTDMMGQFIDQDNPYVTCKNDYIESEWWIINEFNKKGLIYHGSKVLPYCPRCGTELASHEVAQGYKEVSVNTVIVPFKIKNSDTYFLAWTTTPWTLLANLALCVNPKLDYIKVESMGYKFIVAESLANSVLGDDYKVLEKYKGKDLEGTEYEQLIPEIDVEGKAFVVIADDYVTADDGTGIVHVAPAFGDDDNRVCMKNGIAFVNPVGGDGKYTCGPWKGRLVTDPELEIDIIKYLKANDKLFKKIKMTHDYPHCWRCKNPLIYYAKPAWYLNNTAYKDKIIEANSKINWVPSYVGEKRFNNWLNNMIDWGISRNRYWGCPLPIWECSCGHFETVGSLDELQEKIIEDIDVRKIELHRPYVDELHIKCPDCGKTMSRVLDVMDVWFDAGSMPYAQYHYPFENKELFETQFPADFIAEGVDQTRGWFYVLLVISTILSGESSFKNVVVNDMMLDAHGKKMSKSVGNIINPTEIMTEYGADIIRWYMLYVSPVWTPLKFDYDGLREVHSKFYNTLKNTYSFFALYANIDGVDPREYEVDYDSLEEIDKWFLSKYNKLVKNVTNYFEEYDLNKVVRAITFFVSEDLSNWYIRRNRKRFWGSELDNSKKSVYKVTYDVLLGLSKLIAPIVPFVSEEIYQNLTGEESVHLASYPTYDEAYINEEIEERMDLVRDLISLGRNVREQEKIKVRQPLSEVILDKKKQSILEGLDDLIKEELNVKQILFEEDLSKYMNFVVKPNFKEAGKVLGSRMKDFVKYLENLSDSDIASIRKGESIKFEDLDIDSSLIDIKSIAKEGMCACVEGDNLIILNTNLTKELILEGFAREIISKVQNLRKEKDFEIENRIKLYYNGDEEIEEVFTKYNDYIKKETLSTDIIKDEKLTNIFKVNDKDVYLDVER